MQIANSIWHMFKPISVLRLLISGLFALPFALTGPVDAQQPEKVYRIGLFHSAPEAIAQFTDAFRQGMRERDYVEGKNYVLEMRARGPKTDQLSNLAAELVRLKRDLWVA